MVLSRNSSVSVVLLAVEPYNISNSRKNMFDVICVYFELNVFGKIPPFIRFIHSARK